MKLAAMVATVLISGSLAVAQKTTKPGSQRVASSTSHSLPKSVNADAVAATLRTNSNSNSANELSKIEHEKTTASPVVKTPHPVAGPANNASLGKNKPVRCS